MSVVPTRYLIELRDGGRPIGLYLHVHEDAAGSDADTWCGDVTRALRFRTRAAAADFIRDCVGFEAVAAPFHIGELVRRFHYEPEGEVYGLVAH